MSPTPPRAGTAMTPSSGSWRDAIAFIRDPAAFTAGPGRRLGDFYRVRVPGYDLHVVTHPALIDGILLGRGDHFEKSRLYWGELKRIIGEAMASLEGARWRYLRRLEQPYFTPNAAADAMPDTSGIITSELDAVEAAAGPDSRVPVLHVTSRLNTRLVLALFFGQEGGNERMEITSRIVDGEDTIAWRSKFPWRFLTGWLNGRNRRAEAHKAYFQDYADRAEATDAAFNDDLLIGALGHMRRAEDGPGYPHPLLRNEMIVHLGASTETQGVAQGWCLYLLWKHPEVRERLRREVAAVAGGDLVSAEHVPDLVFTLKVVRETLRLFPTAYGVVRDCVEETEISGWPARVGQTYFISLVGLHRSPRFWDEPDRFNPDRWVDGFYESLDRFQYMPFGGGRHVCIGQHFALPATILTIAQFCQRFDWDFSRGDVREVGRATLKPEEPFDAEIRPRSWR